MPKPVIISLGSINMDVQVRTDRWPDSGETLLANEFVMTGGGKAANVAVLARKLGAEALLIGHVGDDSLADDILRGLNGADVDLRHVSRVADASTAVSIIVVRPGGEKTIILAPNANLAWNEGRDAEAIGAAPERSVLVVDLEIPSPVVHRAIQAGRDRSFPVVLDPSPADRVTNDIYEFVSVLTPNTSEAGQHTGIDVDSDEAAERAGRALVDRGVGAVCQKLDGGGCVVVTRDATHHIHPVPVDVVDQTGAGDAFAGGMGVALLEGMEMADAALCAVACSHIAVTAYGSQQSYPSRDDLDRMIARLANENSDHPRNT